MVNQKARASVNNMSSTDISALIYERIHNERNRKIMTDRLINGMTYELIAEKYDLSVRQIKNIVYKALDKML